MEIIKLYSTMELYLLLYLILINIFTFALMGIDKYKAKKNRWRIKERTFFILSFIGGAIGSILGMVTFRHKTQHKTFYIGIPVIYIINKIIIQALLVKIIR